MPKNYLLHITLLSLLIAIASFTGLRAKTVETTIPYDQLTGTKWHVIQINGTTYQDTQGAITLFFTEEGIYVDQTCLSFLSIPQKNGSYKNEQAQNDVLCFMLPPEQSGVFAIFENFPHITPAGYNQIRVASKNGQNLIAQRLPLGQQRP